MSLSFYLASDFDARFRCLAGGAPESVCVRWLSACGEAAFSWRFLPTGVWLEFRQASSYGPAVSGWVTTKLLERRDWADGLSTFTLDYVPPDFEAGQFINLGLSFDDELVKRSYSLASAQGAPAELFITRTSDGRFSPRLFELEVGAELRIQAQPAGFFTLSWLPQAKDLWLLATGTGLGPFVSLLRTGQVWSRFERVVVAHGVRQLAHLAYRDELLELTRGRPLSYVPLVTREAGDVAGQPVLRSRIPEALSDGSLQQRAGFALEPVRGHIMLCGNPDMIKDSTAALLPRGFKKHRRREPGHITTEKYW